MAVSKEHSNPNDAFDWVYGCPLYANWSKTNSNRGKSGCCWL